MSTAAGKRNKLATFYTPGQKNSLGVQDASTKIGTAWISMRRTGYGEQVGEKQNQHIINFECKMLPHLSISSKDYFVVDNVQYEISAVDIDQHETTFVGVSNA